jgi:hypothetical protein
MRRATITESGPAARHHVGEDALGSAIQEEILALRRIDELYDSLKRGLRQRCGSRWSDEGLMRLLEERQRRDRKPHVLRVAQLYHELMSLKLFPNARTLH